MRARLTPALLLLLRLSLSAATENPARDFSGNWVLDVPQSNTHALPTAPGAILNIAQQDNIIRYTEAGAVWTFHTDGTETKYQLRDSSMNSLTKWEGPALPDQCTLVSGPARTTSVNGPVGVVQGPDAFDDHAHYSAGLLGSRGDAGLQESGASGSGSSEGGPAAVPAAAGAPAPPAQFADPGRHQDPPRPGEQSQRQKHSAEGATGSIWKTVFPVTQDGAHLVIPRGSYVAGTVTEVKRGNPYEGQSRVVPALRFADLAQRRHARFPFPAGRLRIQAMWTARKARSTAKGTMATGDAKAVGETTGAGASVGERDCRRRCRPCRHGCWHRSGGRSGGGTGRSLALPRSGSGAAEGDHLRNGSGSPAAIPAA